MLGSASEAAEACLDMEGGAFFLAWVGELIQELAVAGYFRSARLTAQKLCEAAGVDSARTERDKLEPPEMQAWLNLFAETLMDHVIATAK